MPFTSATAAATAANARLDANRSFVTTTYSSAVPKYGFWIGFQDYSVYRGQSPLGGLGTPGLGTSFGNLLGGGAGAIGPGVAGGQNTGIQGGTQNQAQFTTNNGAIFLPLPLGPTVIDAQEVKYTEYDFGSKAAALARAITGGAQNPVAAAAEAGADLLGGIGQFATGYVPSQFYTVLLVGPQYKNYTLSWHLVPHSPQDSQTYVLLINRLRKAAAPEPVAGSIFWQFPEVVQCLYVPQKDTPTTFMYRFKPAVLTRVEVMYAPPPKDSLAFYNNMAPEALQLTLSFLEIEYWIRSNFP